MANVDPGPAMPMKVYMKDRHEFFGLRSPLHKESYCEYKQEYGRNAVKYPNCSRQIVFKQYSFAG